MEKPRPTPPPQESEEEREARLRRQVVKPEDEERKCPDHPGAQIHPDVEPSGS